MSDVSQSQTGTSYGEKAYRDEEVLRELYHREMMSANDIADELGCAPTTVRDWLAKHDIETRSISTAVALAHSGMEVPLEIHRRGYVQWRYSKHAVQVHKLMAIAEWGLDAIAGKEIHHKNGIPWDNRIENLEPVTPSEHKRRHLKVDGVDRIRVAELYENGDISMQALADHIDYDIGPSTVRNIHREFYGGAS